MAVSPKWPVIQIADASGNVSGTTKWPVVQVADQNGNLTTVGANSNIVTALGLAGETISPYDAVTHFPAGSGNLLLVLVYLPTTTISTLGTWVQTAAATATAGDNKMALYTEAGTLVDKTGDMASVLTGTGWVSGALSGGSQSINAGAYYVGLLTHFSTPPEISGVAATASVPVINTHYPSIFFGSQSTIPASITPSSGTRNSGAYYFTVS